MYKDTPSTENIYFVQFSLLSLELVVRCPDFDEAPVLGSKVTSVLEATNETPPSSVVQSLSFWNPP